MQPCATVEAPWCAGGVGEVLDDQRPRQRRDQRVAVHVERVGPQRRQAEVLGELVAGVGDDRLDRPAVQGALADDLQVLAALPDVDGDGDHLAPGLLRDPADGDGGVETSGVRQHDPLAHCSPSSCSRSMVEDDRAVVRVLNVRSSAARPAPSRGSRATTSTVSSPAIQPTTSARAARSSELAR